MSVRSVGCVLAITGALLAPRLTDAGMLTVSCPATPPLAATTFVSEVTVDAGTQALGAYTLAITYDPAVVVVASVDGGTTAEFGSPPIVNPADFSTGRTRLLAFNSSSLTSPTGSVNVARITFNVIGLPGSSTSLAIEIITLADTDGSRITVDTQGCSLVVSTTIPPSASPLPSSTMTAPPTQPPTPTVSPPTPVACSGDCNNDGQVTVDELLRGIDIALDNRLIGECRSFDRSGDGVVTIDEIIVGTKMALDGCPVTPTPTRSPTATPTPTTQINHAPSLPQLAVYRAYPGYDVRLAIGGSDPDGDRLSYSAATLPDGAELDAATGVLSWMPDADQIGPRFVQVTCADNGDPPLSAAAVLAFEVSPLDVCTIPTCDPAAGCTGNLPPLSVSCCAGPPAERVGEPLADCPAGRMLFVGRNTSGFGRLQNCDRLRVINFLQSGASVRFHVEARCVNADQPVTVHTRLETMTRLLFDLGQTVILDPASDGYARKMPVVFPVTAAGPFYDFEGAEAQLTVTLTDADGVVVEERLRLVLTFDALGDLPEAMDIGPPSQ